MQETRRLDRPGYQIDAGQLARYDARFDAFGRRPWNSGGLAFDCHCVANGADDKESATKHCQAQKALSKAANSLELHFVKHFCGLSADPPDSAVGEGEVAHWTGDDPEGNAAAVKVAARKIGADLVGICRVRKDWIYSHDRSGKQVELPEGHDWAVVMVIAMDPSDIMDGAGPGAHMSTMLGYMRMGLYVSALSLFIRQLGWSAVAACNGTGLSIPLAVDAGLGELGRNGLLITPEFGPCVRICKVFTDMPLVADRPVTFGVEQFCRSCRKCSDACEVDAISTEESPDFTPACPSSSSGVRKWCVHGPKCLEYWSNIGGSCSACIAACPYTMIGWHRAAPTSD